EPVVNLPAAPQGGRRQIDDDRELPVRQLQVALRQRVADVDEVAGRDGELLAPRLLAGEVRCIVDVTRAVVGRLVREGANRTRARHVARRIELRRDDLL